MKRKESQLGLWMATSLVVGNMVGSGIFLLPASMAPYRGLGLVGWLITSLGSLLLALVFSRLARRRPQVGGPYAFARQGFGEFAGFLMGWGYWISILATNAAVSVASVSYLTVFWPALRDQRVLAAAVALVILWTLTALNSSGIRNGGIVQLITTVGKLTPLLAMGTVGLFFIDLDQIGFSPPPGHTTGSAVMASVTLTLWAFLGLESATIPSDNVAHPHRTIPKATLLGTALAGSVYILSSLAVMGLVPAEELARSSAPFAQAASKIWGGWGAALVGIGAIVSCVGALNGWILLQGQLPMALAQDGLFPAFFSRRADDGTPRVGILVSSLWVTALLMLNYSRSLVDLFTFVILLATLTAVVPYTFATMTEWMWARKQRRDQKGKGGRLLTAVPLLAFLYSMWAIVGAGEAPVYWGFLLLLTGLPVYAWMKVR